MLRCCKVAASQHVPYVLFEQAVVCVILHPALCVICSHARTLSTLSFLQ